MAEEESAIEGAKESEIENPPQAPMEDFSKSPYPRLPPSSLSRREGVGTFMDEYILKNIDRVKALIGIAVANKEFPADVSIWGISLLNDWRSDTVIDKFLLATNGKPEAAMARIRETIKWREKHGIDKLMKEDLDVPPEWTRAVFVTSSDKRGHPVCYNVYGEFKNRDVYEKTFGDRKKRLRFLRWRFQLLEKAIRERLTFRFHYYSTMVQVFDLKHMPALVMSHIFEVLDLLQNHYPELFANQIFINVPSWVLQLDNVISLRSKKEEFVFAGPAEAADTLFNYVYPENVPVQLGGLYQENNPTIFDGACWDDIQPFSKKIIEIPVFEECLCVWEIKVLGWNVSVGVEFVPRSENGETVTIQSLEKLLASKDDSISKFKVVEPGKLVITVDNATSKKKTLIYSYIETKSSDPTELEC